MISIENISKIYSKRYVLNNINCKIPENSITGIIGPNGAGKSTLIRIITGFETRDTGSVFINDKKIDNFSQIKNQISYMPEEMMLYPDYFVDEFLSFYHAAVNHRDDALLNALSLKMIFNKKIKQLSKGWHQRLKLYTALCNKKHIAILDEPFEGFDPLQMREVASIIRSQNSSGRGFVLSIHQLSYAQKICDYFIFLNRGKLIAQGTLQSLSEKYGVSDTNLEEILIKVIEG